MDAAPLVAAADLADPQHAAVEEVVRRETGRVVVPAPVTAEVHYLLGGRLGARARRAFLDDLATGRLLVEGLDRHEHALAADVDRRYADLDIGLADLSIVVLAHRLDTRRVLTFNERHFRVIRPLQGGSFELLPADA